MPRKKTTSTSSSRGRKPGTTSRGKTKSSVRAKNTDATKYEFASDEGEELTSRSRKSSSNHETSSRSKSSQAQKRSRSNTK